MVLARKILCILHHQLTNRESYTETEDEKTSSNSLMTLSMGRLPLTMTTDKMIKIFSEAGYMVYKHVYGVVHLPHLHRKPR